MIKKLRREMIKMCQTVQIGGVVTQGAALTAV